jgi:hypothetical protein
MVAKPITPEGQRLAAVFADFSAMLFDRPELLEHLPDDFMLVPILQDDPDLTAYALSLTPREPDKPLVYVLMGKHSAILLLPQGPFEVELAAA